MLSIYWVVRKVGVQELYANGLLQIAGDLHLEDQKRPGQPSVTDENLIKTVIENNSWSTTRPGQPSVTDENLIKTVIENNSWSTTRELAEMVNKLKSTTNDNIAKLGCINRLVSASHNLDINRLVSASHNLEEKMMYCIATYESLYKQREDTSFLK
ncbi:hypothetical protein QE152_g10401 [Popillia japonica]|uniref:Uncharacterized protein n=1 Tax=Popillia japonica TaxID=7064 RepID=A0AAW1LRF1_POPJA